jgi:hypothetical protein
MLCKRASEKKVSSSQQTPSLFQYEWCNVHKHMPILELDNRYISILEEKNIFMHMIIDTGYSPYNR